MPWTIEDPPSPPVGDDWTEGQIQRCVEAANAVLNDGGSDEQAIFACIAASGRAKAALALLDDNSQIHQGAAEPIKALGAGKVGAYGVIYGSPDKRDLEGEWFAPDTDYGPHKGNGMAALMHHGIPVGPEKAMQKLANRVLANPVQAQQDEIGIFASHVLDMADDYEAMIYQLAEQGKLRWSSGTAGHLAKVAGDGKIQRWHIIEWSYEPMAAEPRLPTIQPRKSLVESSPEGLAALAERLAGKASSQAEPQGADESIADKGPQGPPDQQERGIIMAENEPKAGDEQPTGGQPTAIDTEALAKSLLAGMSTQMGALVDRAAAEAVIKALSALPTKKAPKMGDPDGSAADGQGKSFADFLLCVASGNHKRLTDVYQAQSSKAFRAREKESLKDLSGAGGASGGYLIPAEFLPQVLQVEAIAAVVRPRAYKQPMSSRTLLIPKLNVEAQPAEGKTYFFGGVFAYWTGEGVAKTETEPSFDQLELRAHKLAGYTQATDELVDDSGIGLSALLTRLFGGAINWVEDWCFLRGTGVGQPMGVLNAGALLTVNRATANQVALVDLANMLGSFLPGSLGRGVWVINITVLPQLVQLADGAGNVVWVPNARDSLPLTIFGMPVALTDKVPALGTTGDVMLCDFGYYVIGDRQATEVAASEHYAFTQDLITWRFVHRVDGQPWLDGPIYIDATNQVSPFVALHQNTS